MRREVSPPRPDWTSRLERLGFDFHTHESGPYWTEDACYALSEAEVDTLEDATNALHALCLEAAERMIVAGDLSRIGVPEAFQEFVASSWRRADPYLYGRFDLTVDASGTPKLLEYNADTPTSLFEAAVVQWAWLEEVRPADDQFNSIHDKLLVGWKRLMSTAARADVLHFTGVLDEPEDRLTTEYMQDLCAQAGGQTKLIDIADIGWNGAAFTDLQEMEIRRLFKLYPWEWLMAEDFGRHMRGADLRLLEPPWKAVLSNKGLLAILWEMFPNHPNLLPASFQRGDFTGPCVEKPLHGREGQGVRILQDEAGSRAPCVWQAYQPLPNQNGFRPVIGSWVIDGVSAGVGIREDVTEITGNASRFTPHYFKP